MEAGAVLSGVFAGVVVGLAPADVELRVFERGGFRAGDEAPAAYAEAYDPDLFC